MQCGIFILTLAHKTKWNIQNLIFAKHMTYWCTTYGLLTIFVILYFYYILIPLIICFALHSPTIRIDQKEKQNQKNKKLQINKFFVPLLCGVVHAFYIVKVQRSVKISNNLHKHVKKQMHFQYVLLIFLKKVKKESKNNNKNK